MIDYPTVSLIRRMIFRGTGMRSWRLLTALFFALTIPLAAQTETVEGTVQNPDGSGFNGTFQVALAKSTVVNTCVSPVQVMPFPGVTIKVTNGVFTPTQLLPTPCLSPSLPYYITVKDSTGKQIYSDNWYLPSLEGGVVNVGTMGSVQLASGITVSVPVAIVGTPSGNQTITQPVGTSLTVNNLTVTGIFSGTISSGCLGGNTVLNGCTGATTSAAAAANIVNGNPIAPSSVASSSVSVATRTIDCASYSTLALCWAAAVAYVTTNETGSGHAVKMLLHDQTYSRGSSVLQVYSGMQVVGVQPRLAANGSTIWQSPTPNGGTWIDCGGGQCFSGGNSAGLTGVSLTNLGFTDFTNAMTFGGSGVNGLSNSVLTQIYFVGAATCCTADTGLVEYNGNFLQISGMYGYNVNTVFDFENLSPVGLISGNSNLYDVYTFTYEKSVAKGNNAKPGIKLGGGVNLINMYRPQVNTYTGDNTGIGIEISASNSNHLFDTDTEGQLLHGIWITNNSGANTIEMAIGTGTTDANYIQIDSGCQQNRIRSSDPNFGFTLSGTAFGHNFGDFPGFITNGDVGVTFNDAYGNVVYIGNGTQGDGSGSLKAANLTLLQSGGTTYEVSDGDLKARATGIQSLGAYGSDLIYLRKDPFIPADNAFEPAGGPVDLGGYNYGWPHVFAQHLDQATNASGSQQFAGHCAMTTTSCTFSIQHAFTYGVMCFPTLASGTYTGNLPTCSVSGTTVTITASSNTATWNALLIGDPF